MQPSEKIRKNRNRSGKISLMYQDDCIQIKVYYSVKQRQDIINQWHKLYNLKTLTAFIHILPN